MGKGWNKGLTKDTDTRIARVSATMRARELDNFREWRVKAKETGIMKSSYPPLAESGDLAELTGVVLGDGHICVHERCESLRITGNASNTQFALRYASIIENVFGKRPTIRKVTASNALTITIYEKYISTRLGIPVGNRKDVAYTLPGWIAASREYKIRFLRGLYEAEGSRSYSARSSTHKLSFANRNSSLLTLVAELVTELGFRVNVSGYRVQVSRKAEVQNLADLLQFRHYVQ